MPLLAPSRNGGERVSKNDGREAQDCLHKILEISERQAGLPTFYIDDQLACLPTFYVGNSACQIFGDIFAANA